MRRNRLRDGLDAANIPRMRRTETVRLVPSRRAERELREIGDRVSRLWNAAMYRCRQAFFAKQGVPVGHQLEALMKTSHDYRQLPSDISQEVLKTVSEAWKSYFTLHANWTKDPTTQKPSIPRYRKDRRTDTRPTDFIPVKHRRSYSLDAKDVSLVQPRDRRSARKGSGKRLHIRYRGRLRHSGTPGRAELVFDPLRKRWHMHVSVQCAPVVPTGSARAAAVDLGVRITASLSIEGDGQARHFEGRELLKDWDSAGRAIAREQTRIARSRGLEARDHPPGTARIRHLHRVRRLRLRHGLTALASAIARECASAGVGTVYLGWPKDILRDVRSYTGPWAGRIHGFWSYGLTLSLLESALEARGITAIRVGERGSSSTCPACGSGDVARHPRWRLSCRACGGAMHSDQAGSRNILMTHKPGACRDWPEGRRGVAAHRAARRLSSGKSSPRRRPEGCHRTATRRWTRHQWHLRSENPRGDVRRASPSSHPAQATA